MREVSKKELELSGNSYLTYHVEPLTRVHLHSSLQGFEPNNNITYIYVLGIIALLVLSIASVNYMNLATAQSAGRTAEIGIRKVLVRNERRYSSSLLVNRYCSQALR